jgi:hypothetical protein
MVFNRSETEAGAGRNILHCTIHLKMKGWHALIGRKVSRRKVYYLQ